MNYQNLRGGLVELNNVSAIDIKLEKPDDIIEAFNIALLLEKSINGELLKLHKVADNENDPQFTDYLEGEFLEEQVDAISEISKIISVLERFNGDQHAIWNYVHQL